MRLCQGYLDRGYVLSLCVEVDSSVVQCERQRDSSCDIDEKLFHATEGWINYYYRQQGQTVYEIVTGIVTGGSNTRFLAMKNKDAVLLMDIIGLFTSQQRA